MLGKVLGGGLPAAARRRPARAARALAPVGEVYQAGTLSGNPLAVAAGLATLALLDDDAYARSRRRPSSSPTACATAAGGRPVSVAWLSRPADRLLRARGRRATSRRQALRPRRPRRLVPRAAGARRLPAAVAVRGLVPFARARRRADRAHGRGGGRAAFAAPAAHERARAPARPGRRRGRADRRRVLDAPPPTVERAAGGARRGGPRAGAGPSRVRAAGRGDLRGLPAALRRLARCSTTADPDLALLAGDRLYALGLERLVALGDLEAVRELADVIALCSLLVARGEARIVRAGCGARGPARSVAAPAPNTSRSRRCCGPGTPQAAQRCWR